jgi:hypothetical protein
MQQPVNTPPAAPNSPATKKLGSILMVLDPKLSRQKSLNLSRLSNIFRQFAEVKVMAASTTEALLLTELNHAIPELILIPWHSYLAWKKVEGLLGLTRASGPTVAGYHCGDLSPKEIGASPDNSRLILLDFDGTSPAESAILVRALMLGTTRSGLLPLLEGSFDIRSDFWYEGQSLGQRIDSVLALPQLASRGWSPRGNALRVLISALWSLIFKESYGAVSTKKILSGAKNPRASIQIGIANQSLVLRLCYSMALSTPKDTLDFFWPKQDSPSSGAQLLIRHSDVLRVHRIMGTQDVEVVAMLFKSGGAEKAPQNLQTFWIEPLLEKLIIEPPYPEAEDANYGTPLEITTPSEASAATGYDSEPSRPVVHPGTDKRELEELRSLLHDLKTQLFAREAYIAELKSGGIGVISSFNPPDADSLLEAFSDRFTMTHDQINGLLEQENRTPGAEQVLKELKSREENWVRKISEMIRIFESDRCGGHPTGQGLLKKTG